MTPKELTVGREVWWFACGDSRVAIHCGEIVEAVGNGWWDVARYGKRAKRLAHSEIFADPLSAAKALVEECGRNASKARAMRGGRPGGPIERLVAQRERLHSDSLGLLAEVRRQLSDDAYPRCRICGGDSVDHHGRNCDDCRANHDGRRTVQ